MRRSDFPLGASGALSWPTHHGNLIQLVISTEPAAAGERSDLLFLERIPRCCIRVEHRFSGALKQLGFCVTSAAASGKELLTLSGHNASVKSVAWSPDGHRLATASEDDTVQIYAMDIRDLMELARHRVSAHPSDEGCKKYLGVAKCPPVPTLPWW
jgi:WD40 repeat protein